MNDIEEKTIEYMNKLGWIFGKYDDQEWHKFERGKNNSMSQNSAKQFYINSQIMLEEAKIELASRVGTHDGGVMHGDFSALDIYDDNNHYAGFTDIYDFINETREHIKDLKQYEV